MAFFDKKEPLVAHVLSLSLSLLLTSVSKKSQAP